MIEQETQLNTAYVYLHRNAKTNVVFYVGISKSNNDGKYYRANRRYNRSAYWNNYTRKHKYTVEIYREGISWDEACSLETQLIFKYGRRENKCGSLVNLTDGGEGVVCLSEEKRLLASMVTKKMWASGKMGSLSKKIFQYSDNGELIGRFSSHKEAVAATGVGRTEISGCVRGKRTRAGGFYWSYSDDLISIPIHRKLGMAGAVGIVGYSIKTDNVYEFESQLEAESYFGIPFLSSSICKVLSGELILSNDILWYKKNHNKKDAIEKRDEIRGHRMIVRISPDGGIRIYDSLKDACRLNNVNNANLCACFTGRQITARGYKWKRLKDYNHE